MYLAAFLVIEMKEVCRFSKEMPFKEPANILFYFNLIQKLTYLEVECHMSQHWKLATHFW